MRLSEADPLGKPNPAPAVPKREEKKPQLDPPKDKQPDPSPQKIEGIEEAQEEGWWLGEEKRDFAVMV